jgi:DNA-binding CsgD family transcriptional regulator
VRLTFDDLGEQELRITDLTSRGFIAKEIGVIMNLSEYRVRNVRSRVIRTLGYRNSVQLSIAYYGHQIRKGKVQPGDYFLGEADFRNLVPA